MEGKRSPEDYKTRLSTIRSGAPKLGAERLGSYAFDLFSQQPYKRWKIYVARSGASMCALVAARHLPVCCPRVVVVDLETTGLDVSQDEIVEDGAWEMVLPFRAHEANLVPAHPSGVHAYFRPPYSFSGKKFHSLSDFCSERLAFQNKELMRNLRSEEGIEEEATKRGKKGQGDVSRSANTFRDKSKCAVLIASDGQPTGCDMVIRGVGGGEFRDRDRSTTAGSGPDGGADDDALRVSECMGGCRAESEKAGVKEKVAAATDGGGDAWEQSLMVLEDMRVEAERGREETGRLSLQIEIANRRAAEAEERVKTLSLQLKRVEHERIRLEGQRKFEELWKGGNGKGKNGRKGEIEQDSSQGFDFPLRSSASALLLPDSTERNREKGGQKREGMSVEGLLEALDRSRVFVGKLEGRLRQEQQKRESAEMRMKRLQEQVAEREHQTAPKEGIIRALRYDAKKKEREGGSTSGRQSPFASSSGFRCLSGTGALSVSLEEWREKEKGSASGRAPSSGVVRELIDQRDELKREVSRLQSQIAVLRRGASMRIVASDGSNKESIHGLEGKRQNQNKTTPGSEGAEKEREREMKRHLSRLQEERGGLIKAVQTQKEEKKKVLDSIRILRESANDHANLLQRSLCRISQLLSSPKPFSESQIPSENRNKRRSFSRTSVPTDEKKNDKTQQKETAEDCRNTEGESWGPPRLSRLLSSLLPRLAASVRLLAASAVDASQVSAAMPTTCVPREHSREKETLTRERGAGGVEVCVSQSHGQTSLRPSPHSHPSLSPVRMNLGRRTPLWSVSVRQAKATQAASNAVSTQEAAEPFCPPESSLNEQHRLTEAQTGGEEDERCLQRAEVGDLPVDEFLLGKGKEGNTQTEREKQLNQKKISDEPSDFPGRQQFQMNLDDSLQSLEHKRKASSFERGTDGAKLVSESFREIVEDSFEEISAVNFLHNLSRDVEEEEEEEEHDGKGSEREKLERTKQKDDCLSGFLSNDGLPPVDCPFSSSSSSALKSINLKDSHPAKSNSSQGFSSSFSRSSGLPLHPPPSLSTALVDKILRQSVETRIGHTNEKPKEREGSQTEEEEEETGAHVQMKKLLSFPESREGRTEERLGEGEGEEGGHVSLGLSVLSPDPPEPLMDFGLSPPSSTFHRTKGERIYPIATPSSSHSQPLKGTSRHKFLSSLAQTGQQPLNQPLPQTGGVNEFFAPPSRAPRRPTRSNESPSFLTTKQKQTSTGRNTAEAPLSSSFPEFTSKSDSTSFSRSAHPPERQEQRREKTSCPSQSQSKSSLAVRSPPAGPWPQQSGGKGTTALSVCFSGADLSEMNLGSGVAEEEEDASFSFFTVETPECEDSVPMKNEGLSHSSLPPEAPVTTSVAFTSPPPTSTAALGKGTKLPLPPYNTRSEAPSPSFSFPAGEDSSSFSSATASASASCGGKGSVVAQEGILQFVSSLRIQMVSFRLPNFLPLTHPVLAAVGVLCRKFSEPVRRPGKRKRERNKRKRRDGASFELDSLAGVSGARGSRSGKEDSLLFLVDTPSFAARWTAAINRAVQVCLQSPQTGSVCTNTASQY
uniref:Uncharacterized protein n=1 Tax=Chromera velia CCMP2878 TaxID=1169474 RepID=A0A0G4HA20_9ALVE|eukprot:Cvel_25603.t1-p1 / transcript=Cvel_25603.t1 / gene=Cvel_25603 / organism=Chromera_velia_CCMP2878 / gene_product=Myosin-10, putative / transcript_product=Myosin-10, putative / location=Cvel_scaffold2922:2346-11934(-) / protein_length=1562 / sequence_SO=supercontig / SO=protein_coding / is_pseudo=false